MLKIVQFNTAEKTAIAEKETDEKNSQYLGIIQKYLITFV